MPSWIRHILAVKWMQINLQADVNLCQTLDKKSIISPKITVGTILKEENKIYQNLKLNSLKVYLIIYLFIVDFEIEDIHFY